MIINFKRIKNNKLILLSFRKIKSSRKLNEILKLLEKKEHVHIIKFKRNMCCLDKIFISCKDALSFRHIQIL